MPQPARDVREKADRKQSRKSDCTGTCKTDEYPIQPASWTKIAGAEQKQKSPWAWPSAEDALKPRFSAMRNEKEALRNPDRFCVCEFPNAGVAEFAPETGALYAAKGQTWIGRDHRIDKNHSSLQF